MSIVMLILTAQVYFCQVYQLNHFGHFNQVNHKKICALVILNLNYIYKRTHLDHFGYFDMLILFLLKLSFWSFCLFQLGKTYVVSILIILNSPSPYIIMYLDKFDHFYHSSQFLSFWSKRLF